MFILKEIMKECLWMISKKIKHFKQLSTKGNEEHSFFSQLQQNSWLKKKKNFLKIIKTRDK